MRKQTKSLLCLLILVASSIGIDQITKRWAQKELLLSEHQTNLTEYQGKREVLYTLGQPPISLPAITHESVPHGYVSFGFCYVRNQGAAWGALSDLDEHIRVPFFYLVTMLAIIIILHYLQTTPLQQKTARLGFALVLSGAIGNFIDRVRLGYVIDFLDVNWALPLPWKINFSSQLFTGKLSFLNFDIHSQVWAYDFPKFNWADSMITIGVTLLLIDMLILEGLRKKRPTLDCEEGNDHGSETLA